MEQRAELQGLRGVGFLFAMILLFLAVVCLKQTGHADLAGRGGLAGAILLAGGSGWFLLRKRRHPSARPTAELDGDVVFSAAVCLVCLVMVAAEAARMLH